MDGLLLYFSYLCKNDGIIYVWDGENITYMRIQEVVKKFTAYFCTGLKNKPKVFIFDVSVKFAYNLPFVFSLNFFPKSRK